MSIVVTARRIYVSDVWVEPGPSQCHQRVRDEQVERDWQESRQACQSVRAVCKGTFRWQDINLEGQTIF